MPSKRRAVAPLTPTQRRAALKAGYRSGLEGKVAAQLRTRKIKCDYESVTIRWSKPAQEKKYTPDFPLPNGIIIETKGRFVTADRQKHIYVKEQHPGLDIRFVFSNPKQRISKTSKTTYAMWCDKYGYKYAKGLIPDAWLAEPRRARRYLAMAHFMKEK